MNKKKDKDGGVYLDITPHKQENEKKTNILDKCFYKHLKANHSKQNNIKQLYNHHEIKKGFA